jgi:hypothetical protein
VTAAEVGNDFVEIRLDELTAVVSRLSADLEDLAAVVAVSEDPKGVDPVRSPMYETLDAWVRDYFAPMFSRPIGGEIRWCPRWHEHAEAVSRLEALWRSWERFRLDPALGMATWYSGYLDHQLPLLLGRAGPFSQCSADRHAEPTPLPLTRLSESRE